MLESPHLTRTEAQQTAVIHLTIPRAEIRHVMGPGIQELMAAVAAQGIGPTGPWFSHHLAMHPDTFDFEIGVPVSGPVTPVGRVTAGSLPGGRVARTVLHGNYDGLGDGWGEFLGWIAGQGHETAPDLWEVYVKGPESDPDPAAWRTELNKPLID
ncbi:MAG TPA: GyrI-like domain-containing protein [Telluria sp.]|jgi:effector-binding domain-containing protein